MANQTIDNESSCLCDETNKVAILSEKQVKGFVKLFNECSSDARMSRRNDKVMDQCDKLFDQGHRCIVIKPGTPFTYRYCGQKFCERSTKK